MVKVMDKQRRGQGDLLTLSTIAYRNIWRNGRRTILCIIAVAVAVFLIFSCRPGFPG